MRTWFITGASRGLGAHIAKAALMAGDRVVATSRKVSTVTASLGSESDRLLPLPLDVTEVDQAQIAVNAATAKFGGIDVLVNNAGYWQAGFFEEVTAADAEAQFATNLFGVFYVTWAVLPVMRAARRGHIFNLSSLGGLIGAQMGSLYCASKFAIEGFSESLAKEINPFGIRVTIVEPGPFRTDFLTDESLRFEVKEIADYEERRSEIRAGWKARNGLQPGDPQRLAAVIVGLANETSPPLRFLAGSVAIAAAEQKLAGMMSEIESWRALSLTTDGEYPNETIGGLLSQLK